MRRQHVNTRRNAKYYARGAPMIEHRPTTTCVCVCFFAFECVDTFVVGKLLNICLARIRICMRWFFNIYIEHTPISVYGSMQAVPRSRAELKHFRHYSCHKINHRSAMRNGLNSNCRDARSHRENSLHRHTTNQRVLVPACLLVENYLQYENG